MSKTAQVLLLLISVFLVYLLFPSPIIAVFIKSSANPLLNTDTKLTEPLSMPVSSVVQTGTDFKIWFTEYINSKHQISLATSPDGISWTKHSPNPVISPNVSDPWEKEIGEPFVIYTNDNYTMWFTSYNFTQKEAFKISRSISTDGIDWSPHQIIFTKSSAAWESEGVNRPSVLLINGVYKMWYGARDSTGTWRIGYATSLDGIGWTRNPNPVLQPSFSWEDKVVAAANVNFLDGIYHMYYHAGPIFPYNIGHAVSTDGISWVKDPNPILTRGNNFLGDFDWNMISTPAVIRVNNKLRMYYAGHDGAHWQFGLAEETLPVPYFSQSDPLWGNDIYDHMNTTMASRGCAVTSAAMILKHFNVQNTPGNPDASPNPLLQQIINPGTLNEWMKSRNDSTFKSGATNWALIGTLTKQTHELDPTNPHLEFTYMDTSELDNLLSQNLPVILDLDYPPSPSGAHFVVATKKEGDNYLINDPLDETRTTLNPYYSIIDRIGYFDVTNSDFSYLILAVNPQIDIKLRDEGGMEVGYQFIQDPVVDSVTNSTSGAEQQKMLFLKHPPSGKYTLKISALNNQTFQLDTYLYDQNGDGGLKTFTGIVGPNDTDTFSINIDPENSENSIIQNQITFLTLINDINTSFRLKWIKKPAYKFLLPQAKLAQKFYQKNKKLFVKKILEGMLMQLKIFSELNLVNTEAYKLLKFDIEYLLSVL